MSKMTKRGYILEYCPKHPNCNSSGWMFQHRLKMEEYLGRYLDKKEVVHHIDGDKTNNFIGNLMLFSSHSEHLKHELSSEQARTRLRENGYLRVQNKETRQKCAFAKMGNKHCVGRKYSKETIEKMRISRLKHLYGENYATN